MSRSSPTLLRAFRLWAGLWAVAASSGLGAQTISVEFNNSDHVFSNDEKTVIAQIATSVAAEIREVLPQVPPTVTLTVSAGEAVIEETGEMGMAPEPGRVSWTVDASRPEGVIAIANGYLRSTLFHELHHLARGYVVTGGSRRTSFMDVVVSEGLATAFERDFAGVKPPWGDYPEDVSEWVDELVALPMSAFGSYTKWMLEHPDGRRWIGYRAGTYIVDQAMAASGKSTAELVLTGTAEILQLAGIDEPP